MLKKKGENILRRVKEKIRRKKEIKIEKENLLEIEEKSNGEFEKHHFISFFPHFCSGKNIQDARKKVKKMITEKIKIKS